MDAPCLEKIRKKLVPEALSGGQLSQIPVLFYFLHAAKEFKDGRAEEALLSALKRRIQEEAYDRAEGGVFDSACGKSLALNARFVLLFLEAHDFFKEPFLKEKAFETLCFLRGKLYHSQQGAFLGGQAFKSGYYQLSRQERLSRESPSLDLNYAADSNAMMVSALLKAASVFPEERRDYETMAQEVLRFLRERLYDPSCGIRRGMDFRGVASEDVFLRDQAWTMLALTDAYQYFADPDYREFADTLMKLALRNFWAKERGGFRDDSVEDPMLSAEENAAALEALWRLHYLKGNAYYRKWLEMGMEAVLPQVLNDGTSVAPYGQLLDLMMRGRLEFYLVGRKEDPKTRDLILGLYRHYLPRRMFSFIDPSDMDFILSHRLTVERTPRVFVILNGRPAGSASTPEEIPAILEKLI